MYRQFKEHGKKAESAGVGTGVAVTVTEDDPIIAVPAEGEAAGPAAGPVAEGATTKPTENATEAPDDKAEKPDTGANDGGHTRFVPPGTTPQVPFLLTEVWDGPTRVHTLRSVLTAVEEKGSQLLIKLDPNAAQKQGKDGGSGKGSGSKSTGKSKKDNGKAKVVNKDNEADAGAAQEEPAEDEEADDVEEASDAEEAGGEDIAEAATKKAGGTGEAPTTTRSGRVTRAGSRAPAPTAVAEPPKTAKKRKASARGSVDGEAEAEIQDENGTEPKKLKPVTYSKLKEQQKRRR